MLRFACVEFVGAVNHAVCVPGGAEGQAVEIMQGVAAGAVTAAPM